MTKRWVLWNWFFFHQKFIAMLSGIRDRRSKRNIRWWFNHWQIGKWHKKMKDSKEGAYQILWISVLFSSDESLSILSKILRQNSNIFEKFGSWDLELQKRQFSLSSQSNGNHYSHIFFFDTHHSWLRCVEAWYCHVTCNWFQRLPWGEVEHSLHSRTSLQSAMGRSPSCPLHEPIATHLKNYANSLYFFVVKFLKGKSLIQFTSLLYFFNYRCIPPINLNASKSLHCNCSRADSITRCITQ